MMRKPAIATSLFLFVLPILRFILDEQLARFDLQEQNYAKLISKRHEFTDEEEHREIPEDPLLLTYPDIVINHQANLALTNLALGRTYLNNESFIDELHAAIDEYLANQTTLETELNTRLKKLTDYQIYVSKQTIRELREFSQRLDTSHATVIASGRWMTNKLIAFTGWFPENLHSEILAFSLLLFLF